MFRNQYGLPTEPTDHMLSDLFSARFHNANRRSVMYISQYVLPTEPCDQILLPIFVQSAHPISKGGFAVTGSTEFM